MARTSSGISLCEHENEKNVDNFGGLWQNEWLDTAHYEYGVGEGNKRRTANIHAKNECEIRYLCTNYTEV